MFWRFPFANLYDLRSGDIENPPKKVEMLTLLSSLWLTFRNETNDLLLPSGQNMYWHWGDSTNCNRRPIHKTTN